VPFSGPATRALTGPARVSSRVDENTGVFGRGGIGTALTTSYQKRRDPRWVAATRRDPHFEYL